MFSADVKHGLIDHMPALAIADVLGATEGGMGTSVTTKDTPRTETAKFSLNATSKVFGDDGSRGRPRVRRDRRGRQRRHGPDRLLQGPREVGAHVPGGRRRALLVPRRHGDDRGRRHARAVRPRLELHQHRRREGLSPRRSRRRSRCHPAVEDALVFGVPDDRFGERVVGVVSLSPGAGRRRPTTIIADARDRLSSYKLPEGAADRRPPSRAPRTARPTTARRGSCSPTPDSISCGCSWGPRW